MPECGTDVITEICYQFMYMYIVALHVHVVKISNSSIENAFMLFYQLTPVKYVHVIEQNMNNFFLI